MIYLKKKSSLANTGIRFKINEHNYFARVNIINQEIYQDAITRGFSTRDFYDQSLKLFPDTSVVRELASVALVEKAISNNNGYQAILSSSEWCV